MWAGQKSASAGLPHGNGYFAKFHLTINGVDHSDMAGILGLYRDLLAKAAEGMTTRQAIRVWAPKTDGNDTENYIKETARRAGIVDVDVPLILLPIVSIEVIP